jgi:hypothetical protein
MAMGSKNMVLTRENRKWSGGSGVRRTRFVCEEFVQAVAGGEMVPSAAGLPQVDHAASST